MKCIPMSISLLQWDACFVFAFFHTLLITYKNLWFTYGKFNLFFLPQSMATLGPFFKKFCWKSCSPFLLSPSAKNPLSFAPPPPLPPKNILIAKIKNILWRALKNMNSHIIHNNTIRQNVRPNEIWSKAIYLLCWILDFCFCIYNLPEWGNLLQYTYSTRIRMIFFYYFKKKIEKKYAR